MRINRSKNLASLLLTLYQHKYIRIDPDQVPSYTAVAIRELYEYWLMNMPGMFDVNKIEDTSAYAILKRHNEMIDEDGAWLERLSTPNARAH